MIRGNRVSKSDRPFGGKNEEEGSLLKMLAVANRCSNSGMRGVSAPGSRIFSIF